MKNLNKKSKTSIVILLLILMVVISAVGVLFLKKNNFKIKTDNSKKIEEILKNNDKCIIERKNKLELEKIRDNYYEVKNSFSNITKGSLVKKEKNKFYLLDKGGVHDISKKILYFDLRCE